MIFRRLRQRFPRVALVDLYTFTHPFLGVCSGFTENGLADQGTKASTFWMTYIFGERTP